MAATDEMKRKYFVYVCVCFRVSVFECSVLVSHNAVVIVGVLRFEAIVVIIAAAAVRARKVFHRVLCVFACACSFHSISTLRSSRLSSARVGNHHSIE